MSSISAKACGRFWMYGAPDIVLRVAGASLMSLIRSASGKRQDNATELGLLEITAQYVRYVSDEVGQVLLVHRCFSHCIASKEGGESQLS